MKVECVFSSSFLLLFSPLRFFLRFFVVFVVVVAAVVIFVTSHLLFTVS